MKINKKNWLILSLVGLVGFFLFREAVRNGIGMPGIGVTRSRIGESDYIQTRPEVNMLYKADTVMPVPEEVPVSESKNRMVVRDSDLSVLVKDVGAEIKKIEAEAVRRGGFMVSSYLGEPEGASSGNITIRVPTDKLDEFLDAVRIAAVRVVYENVQGRDVTDEYEDLEARLAILLRTKTKFEQIFDQASTVSDMLSVQRELVSLQSQIDSVKGRQQYLSQTAKLVRVSVYLSTDELALPYSPDQPWRVEVVFKTAVRSLVSTTRGLINGLIWLGVYSPVWLLILGGVFWAKKRRLF